MHLTCIRAAERAHTVLVRPGRNESEPLRAARAFISSEFGTQIEI